MSTQILSKASEPDSTLSLSRLLDPEVLADPYPLYHRLRSEAPVHWDPFLHSWVVTRYHDVVRVLRDFSANRTPAPEQLTAMGLSAFNPIAQVMVKQMLFMDPPAHTRLRNLASTAFTPHRVEVLRGHIRDIVTNLVDAVQARGRMDVIADIAEPLPCIVTAEMLGVPVEDYPRLKDWSKDFAEMLGNFQHNPDRVPQILKSVQDMTAYFHSAIHEQRLRPRGGLVSSLMNAEVQGDRLTEEEVIANCIVTMVGGQETTTNLIGNGVLSLLRNPDQIEKLRADLSLIPSAVEELLRYESPSQHTARLAPEDTEIGGKQIHQRQAVMAVMAAANRDPERFPDPDRLDITRKDNRHVAFGWGAHFCFGAPLARIEGQIVFEEMLRRLPNWSIEPCSLTWRTNLGLRGLTALPVRFGEPTSPDVSAPPANQSRTASSGTSTIETNANTMSLSDAKRKLLEKFRRGEMAQAPVRSSTITRRPSGELPPLSLTQEQLWLFERARSGTPPLYNESITLRRMGPLDPGLLQRSLTELVRRHEIWRTSYDTINGVPVQIVRDPPLNFPMTVVSLDWLPEAERETEALRLATDQARRPFDFQRGPLLRATVVKMSDAESRLLLTGHQSIIDGVSIYQVFLSELVALYEAFSAGKPSPLPPLPIQFADYAHWQRQWLPGETLQKQLAYWRRQLGGELPLLRWPNDHPRPTMETFNGTVHSFTWSKDASDVIRALKRHNEFTLFTILLSGFIALLHRYTGQNDILVGTLSPAGRKRSETQGLLGYFLNPVALRFDLSRTPTFRELLRHSQEVTAEAISHDDVPFELLVEELKPKPDPSRNPFFTVGISLQPPMPDVGPGWSVTSMDAGNGGSRWDLYLAFIEREDGLMGRAQYNPDLFDASTIQQMLADLESLLATAVADPQRQLSSLTLSTIVKPSLTAPVSKCPWIAPPASAPDSPARAQQNLTGKEGPTDKVQQDDPPRLSTDTYVMPRWYFLQDSWVEDPLKSNSVAYNYPLSIRMRGVLNQQALEQSLREVVRRHDVLRSAFRLVDRKLTVSVLPLAPLALPMTDFSDLGAEERESKACQLALAEANQPFDLSLGHLLRAKLLRLGPEDHVLLLITHHIVCDDWSTGILWREISLLYGEFVAGKSSSLPELDYRYGDFVRWQQSRLQGKELESRLSFWKERLAGAGDFHHLVTDFPRPPRQTIRGAHEKTFLSEDLINSLRLLAQREHVSLFMVLVTAFQCLLRRYSGHTDIAVGSCVANRSQVQVEGLIGPFGNVVVMRTDLSGNPSFRELLGRVRQSALSSLSCQDLPFGQLVKAVQPAPIPDRNPVFQVLFVLENAPKEEWQFPGLSWSWFPLDTGTTRYELNVSLRIGKLLEVDLQYNADLFAPATMKRTLADYHAILEELVRNVELCVGDLQLGGRGVSGEAQPLRAMREKTTPPGDNLEARLVEIWEAAFGKRPIGVNQNFFELGGDSLLATRLFTQIEKVFKTKVPLVTLFKAQTVAELADMLRDPASLATQSSLVPIQTRGSRPPLFCVHDHTGEVLFCRGLSQHLGPDQPVYGLQAQGVTGQPAHRTIEAMAAHYIEEIRTVQRTGPYSLAGYCFGGSVVFEMARQLRARGEEVALVAMFNAPAPGSLEGWPFGQFIYLKIRIKSELKKLSSLQTSEKRKFLARKARGLARLALSSVRMGASRIFSYSSPNRADKWTERILAVPDLNVAAAKAYNPPGYPGKIILFLTGEAPSLYAIDPKVGWTALAAGGIEVYEVPGDNTSMFESKLVGQLAEKLKCVLRRNSGS